MGRRGTEKAAGWPLSWRITLTVLLALLPLVGERVPLPGVDLDETLLEASGGSPSIFSAFALGISPLMSAYLVVELAAVMVPRWRKLRHAFPDGRARLRRATMIVALVFAVFQSFGTTMMMSAPELGALGEGWGERLVPMLTLVGATCVLVLAASMIDRLGLLNGVLALELVSIANRALPLLEPLVLPKDPLRLASLAVAIVLPIVATWVVCVASERGRQVDSPWLSLPSSSVHPVRSTLALFAFPATLASLELPGAAALRDLCEGPGRWPLSLAVGVLVTFGFAVLLQEPARVAHVVGRIDDERAPSSGDARAALWRSLLPSGLFVLALFGAEELAQVNRLPVPLAPVLALITALVLDAKGALTLHWKQRDWVRVWEERRPYAVPALVAVAAREGLTLRTTGVAQTSMLRFFGPYAAIGLWCAPADVEHARALLGELLTEANEPVPPREASAETPVTEPAAQPAPKIWAGTETWLLGALCALPLLLTWLVAAEQARPEPPLRARFEIVLIDDAVDPLAPTRGDELPAGVSLYKENLYGASPDEPEQRHYANLEPLAGETFEQATRRVEPWLATLALPAGARFAWEPSRISVDAGGKRDLETGRTYVLSGPPIITARDVQSAKAILVQRGEACVDLRFTPEAGERFRIATRDHLNRRMALMVNGRIESAPIIRSEIRGGTVQITLAQPEDPEHALREAEAFVEQLRSGQAAAK